MDKTILITGANGNLGAATVKKFLDEGYKVVAVDHSGTHLGFAASHDNFELRAVDLSDEEAVVSFMEEIIELYGLISPPVSSSSICCRTVMAGLSLWAPGLH